MQDLKSFKKYSWIISGIFAVLIFISGLTANDISFLPTKYQSIAVGIIGASAVLVKLIPENYRVTRAEDIAKAELINEFEIPESAYEEFLESDVGDEEGV